MDNNKEQEIKPGLYLVSTPIGNMQDITLRAINLLKKSDIILCEDTRRSRKLLSYYKIRKTLQPYHKFNEKKISENIVNLIKKNKIISLVSDAGTPTISDPGKILVNRCLEENLSVYPIPGASAVTSAVSILGFTDQYLFYGFLSKSKNELENELKNLSNLNYSLVFFIPGSEINFYISKFKIFFSGRQILVAKEMTKIHEKFFRTEVEKLELMNENIKGEFTVVISKKINEKKLKKEITESVKVEIIKMLKKYSHKDVVEYIAKKENLPKKTVYNFCLKFKK